MIGAVTINKPESVIDAAIMTMNAPAATIQWRALLCVFVATTLVMLTTPIGWCSLRRGSRMTSLDDLRIASEQEAAWKASSDVTSS